MESRQREDEEDKNVTDVKLEAELVFTLLCGAGRVMWVRPPEGRKR